MSSCRLSVGQRMRGAVCQSTPARAHCAVCLLLVRGGKMAASSIEQKLSRLEAKLKQENREAKRRIELEISPQRARPTLQLPLANDGHTRPDNPTHHHPSHPARPRHMLSLPQTNYLTQRSLESTEIDQKLQEIIKQTGYLVIDGQKYQADINDLENLGEIGSGTCGQVWKMRFKKTGHIIAVKQMRRSGNKEENKRILMDLDVVLKSHDCPYIVQCYGTFITNTDVFIAMELMGTCAEKLKKRIQGPIPESILGKMTVAIVNALYYLKEKHGVIHRDVKPSNILLDASGQIKLCDFGISGRLVDSKAKTRSAGCAAYMAPERIDPPDPTKPDYDIRADVWSLGISLVELATGQFPYKNCKTDFEVLTKVLQEEPPVLPHNMGFSPLFQSFVKDCLTKDHRKRPKYNKLLEHPFLRQYETQEVDVASWFQDVMAQTESPRSSTLLSPQNLPFFGRDMSVLIILYLCVGLVRGPPPWLNPAVSRAFRLKHLSQTPSPSPILITCRYPNNKFITALKEREIPCPSEDNLLDSVAVQLLVRGPERPCEHGSMCSVKVGSKLHVEVSLSAAPPSIGLSLALCSLSPSSDPFDYSHTLLVVNGCPADVGVSLTLAPPLLCTKTLMTKTFDFQLAPFYNSSIQFLHCRVQLCSRQTSCGVSGSPRNIPECDNTEELCTRMSAAPLFLRPELQRIVTQPLVVTISAPTRPVWRSGTGVKKLPVFQHQEPTVHGVGIAGAVGVTVSSFFIGMILTAGLWCIHSKTAAITQRTPAS